MCITFEKCKKVASVKCVYYVDKYMKARVHGKRRIEINNFIKYPNIVHSSNNLGAEIIVS